MSVCCAARRSVSFYLSRRVWMGWARVSCGKLSAIFSPLHTTSWYLCTTPDGCKFVYNRRFGKQNTCAGDIRPLYMSRDIFFRVVHKIYIIYCIQICWVMNQLLEWWWWRIICTFLLCVGMCKHFGRHIPTLCVCTLENMLIAWADILFARINKFAKFVSLHPARAP